MSGVPAQVSTRAADYIETYILTPFRFLALVARQLTELTYFGSLWFVLSVFESQFANELAKLVWLVAALAYESTLGWLWPLWADSRRVGSKPSRQDRYLSFRRWCRRPSSLGASAGKHRSTTSPEEQNPKPTEEDLSPGVGRAFCIVFLAYFLFIITAVVGEVVVRFGFLFGSAVAQNIGTASLRYRQWLMRVSIGLCINFGVSSPVSLGTRRRPGLGRECGRTVKQWTVSLFVVHCCRSRQSQPFRRRRLLCRRRRLCFALLPGRAPPW